MDQKVYSEQYLEAYMYGWRNGGKLYSGIIFTNIFIHIHELSVNSIRISIHIVHDVFLVHEYIHSRSRDIPMLFFFVILFCHFILG